MKHKDSKKTKVSGHYNMRGMGAMLNMYSQAGGATEREAQDLQLQISNLTEKIKNESDSKKKVELKELRSQLEKKLQRTTEQMKQLLRGIADTTSKAAMSLSETMVSAAQKMEKLDLSPKKQSGGSGSKWKFPKKKKSPAPSVSSRDDSESDSKSDSESSSYESDDSMSGGCGDGSCSVDS